MDDETSYSLILAFDTNDPEFIRGFEAGRLWQILKAGAIDEEFTVHHENAEMVLRMAEALGLSVRSAPLDDGYMVVAFS